MKAKKQLDSRDFRQKNKVLPIINDDSFYSMCFAACIKKLGVRYYFNLKVEDYYYKCSMIFFIQILIIGFISYSAFRNEKDAKGNDTGKGMDGLCWIKPDFYKMILRLLCAYLFHLQNYGDVADSFKRLKFVRKNPQLIEPKYIGIAFAISMYQFLSSFLCEAVNIFFLCRQDKLTDIIMNYVAFASVSEFDNIYFSAVRQNLARDTI